MSSKLLFRNTILHRRLFKPQSYHVMSQYYQLRSPTLNIIRYNFCTKPEGINDDKNSDNSDSMDNVSSNQSVERSRFEYSGGDPGQTRSFTFLSWRVVFVTIVVTSIGVIIFQQLVHKQKKKEVYTKYESFGNAQIGSGDWEMMDHNGKVCKKQDLLGKYQIVYFGFTFCPDVCPRELTKMAQAITYLEETGYGDDIIPLFVSVDPKRDSASLVKKYIKQFHPKIYGLTGTPKQVETFAKAYRAYYSSPGPRDNENDYIIDHVTMMYVMNRNGDYLGHISTLEDANDMANKIKSFMKDVKPNNSFLSNIFSSKTK